METNLVRVAVVEESTWGTTPAAAGRLLNVSAPGMTRNRATQVPGILRPDYRNFKPTILSEDGAFTVAGPLQFDNFVELIEGLLMADRTAELAISAATISFDATTDTVADSGNGLGAIKVGDFVWIGGAGDSGNNGRKGPVLTAAAGAITFPDGQITATAAASPTITIGGTRIVDATTKKSFTLQHDYTATGGIAATFRVLRGARVGGYSVTWQSGSFPVESFTGQGKAPVWEAATAFTGAYGAAVTHGHMNPLGDLVSVRVNGTEMSEVISSLQLTCTRGLRPHQGVRATAGPQQVGVGGLGQVLVVRAYKSATSQARQVLADANTSVAVDWVCRDEQGNERVYYLPAMALHGGDEDASGPDTDAFDVLTLTAYEDVAEDLQMGIYEHAA